MRICYKYSQMMHIGILVLKTWNRCDPKSIQPHPSSSVSFNSRISHKMPLIFDKSNIIPFYGILGSLDYLIFCNYFFIKIFQYPSNKLLIAIIIFNLLHSQYPAWQKELMVHNFRYIFLISATILQKIQFLHCSS